MATIGQTLSAISAVPLTSIYPTILPGKSSE
ncbi:hypothetical protein BLA29_015351 [Euroglyphus maynei]|uniref:Uncharacterized protein n=1 Tax=Euroglyphus maynei TaxID=6958 RepID=A0A1Y3AMU8_EURMA|nr:hypothetical protein BLA29_015351 [Euroglyphus maynei]